MHKKRVLIIGPFPLPVTGLNFSNETVRNILKSEAHQVAFIDTEINRNLDESIGKFKWYKLKMISYYFQSYKIFSCDVVYCTIGQTFLGIVKYLPFLTIARLFSKKTIVHLHGNALLNNYNNFSKLKQKLARLTLKKIDEAIVLSSSMRENFIPFIEEHNIHICHNFISMPEAAQVKENKAPEALNILFLSNLLPAKGITVFLEAISILQETYNDISVKIAGTVSEDYPEVLEVINQIPNTTFVGRVAGVEKSNLYQWADIFCMPTLNKDEGQPLVILEALKNSCYIIASDVPGISDILDSKNGELLWPMQAESIKKAVARIKDNPERLLAVKDHNAQYAKQFHLENFSARILKIITA